MSSLLLQPRSGTVQTVAVAAVLILIGWSAWKCIPEERSVFSESEMTRNRAVVKQVRLYTAPASITGQYHQGETDLTLSPGATIRYDVAQLDGLLHAVYQAAGPDIADLEISAVSDGKSTLLLKRRLSPSERILDTLPSLFLCNPADLPPHTQHILLSAPSSSYGSVNWQKTGSFKCDQVPALAQIPLDFVSLDAYRLPGWDNIEKFIMLHAPTRMTFRVPAGRHHLSFSYGYNPAIFSDPAASPDGAEFSAVLHTSSGPRELMKRLLEPITHAADRELQSASFDLELAEPGRLDLVMTAGPNDSIAWDWLVLRNVRFEPVGK